MSISIIIPYKHSVNVLHKCLQSIETQTIIPDIVICICNNSSLVIPSFTYSFPIHFIHEYIEGSYHCRNIGIKYKEVDYYFFIDADCILHPKYIQNMLKYCQEDVILSGHIDIMFNNSIPNIFEWYDRLFYLDQEDYANKGFGATAALVVPSKIFKEIGLFSEVLSGGDLEFGLRAIKNNYNIKYNKESIVYHPSRDTFKLLFLKARRIKRGHTEIQHVIKQSYFTIIKKLILKHKKFNIPYRYILTSLILHKVMMSILFVENHLLKYSYDNNFVCNFLEEYI